MAAEKTKGLDVLNKEAAEAADENGMCTVRALKLENGRVRDNGKYYDTGQVFHMHRDLVPVHMQAGQVELVDAAPAGKQATAPADKQVSGSPNK